MKGRLFLRDDKWFVEYQVINSTRSLPLHPDNDRMISFRSDKQPIHIIGEKVDFEIKVSHTDPNDFDSYNMQVYAELTKCNGLDLKKLETKLDYALSNETTESLTDWMNNKRKHLDAEYTEDDMLEFANWCRIHDNTHKNEVWMIQQLWSKYKKEINKTG